MSRNLSTEIQAKLAEPTCRPVYMVCFDFVGWSLKECTGNHSHSYYGDTYEAASFTLEFPTVTESIELSADSVTFSLSGSTELPINLSDVYNYRNREVDMYIGFEAADGTMPNTNVYKLFSGLMSEVEFVEDGESDTWQVKAESKLVDLQNEKVARYTHQSQLNLHAGDKGLEFASTAQAGLFLSRNETPDEPYTKKIIYGTAKVEGSVVFMATSGSGSRYLNLLVAFAGHECESIQQVYLDDRPLLASGSVSGEFSQIVTYQERLGTSTQAYVSELATEVGSSVWTSDHQLKGICYCYLRILYSEDLFGSSAPKISAVIEGKKLYDPRTGGEYFNDNPALAVRDYLLNTVYGFSSGSARVDDALITVAANDCDLLVDKKDGTQEKRYRLNGFLSTEETIGNNLKLLLASMAGKISYLGGEFAVYAGTYALSSFVITEDDITAPLNLTSNSVRSSYNGARGIHTSQDLEWKEDEFPPYQDSSDLTEDGVSRFIDLPLPFTKSASACQRIAKITVKRTRCSRKLSLQTSLSDLNIRAGDVVSITSEKTEIDGGVYEVQSMSIVNGLEPYIDMELFETKSSVYDWDASTEETEVDTTPSVSNSVLAWSLARLGSPTASPATRSYTIAFNVTVSHNEIGVTCRYTTDGSEPDENDSSVANGGTISISGQTITLKLKSFQNSGSLTSEVVTYEYTYNAPTNLVNTPLHRFYFYSGSGVSNSHPYVQFAVPTLGATNLYHTRNGGSNWLLLKNNTAAGTYYTDPTLLQQSWTPSNYRAYATKAGYIDSNQRVVPNQCIPPLVMGVYEYQNSSVSYFVCLVFGSSVTLYLRYRARYTSVIDGSTSWGSWSSWFVNGSGWSWGNGVYNQAQYSLYQKLLHSNTRSFQWEAYTTQSGFTNSIVSGIQNWNSPTSGVVYHGSDTGTDKYGTTGTTSYPISYTIKPSSWRAN